MYKFRNGDEVIFKEQNANAFHITPGSRAECTVPKNSVGTVIQTDKKRVAVDMMLDEESFRVVVELKDWDGVESHAQHESETCKMLRQAASFMASKCKLDLLSQAIIHHDHDCSEQIEEHLRFLKASAACYRQADDISESFHVGERAWLAECAKGDAE